MNKLPSFFLGLRNSQDATDTLPNTKQVAYLFIDNQMTEALDIQFEGKDTEAIIRQRHSDTRMGSGGTSYQTTDPLLRVKESIYQISEKLRKVDEPNKIKLRRFLYYESGNYFLNGGSLEDLLKILDSKTSQVKNLGGNVGGSSGGRSAMNHKISGLKKKFKSLWIKPRNP